MKGLKLLYGSIILLLSLWACQTPASDDQPAEQTAEDEILTALIVDGQNNHGAWPKTTLMMKDYLEQTGLFEVAVERTAYTWQGPHNDASIGKEARINLIQDYPLEGGKPTTATEEPRPDPDFKPNFSNYDVVLVNFGWKTAPWPEETQKALEDYVNGGGGLVIVHAANNAFENWPAYNEMIGLGGWGDRTEKDGPYVYYNDSGKLVRDTTAGPAGSHGPQYEFLITIRDTTHPITRGLPAQWMHTKDELYDRLRGPAKNIKVLATAYSDVEKNGPPWDPKVKGSGRHEPMLLTVNYGQGRVFHTIIGHTDYSMESVGFIVTLQRGAEWAASGEVTQTGLPADFPTAEKASQRKWNLEQ